MRAVITVVGKDTVGILAKVSTFCAEHDVNVVDVSQTILQDMFCMIMLVDTAAMPQRIRRGKKPQNPRYARGHIQLDAQNLKRRKISYDEHRRYTRNDCDD